MSMHSFDPEVAAEVGLAAAVLYQNIVWWTAKNAANGKHQHEGRWWTYNSVKAWATLFPYLTEKQIRTALERLEDAGFIASGHFGDNAYDRSKWYSPIRQSDLPKKANGTDQGGKSLTDSKPDIKPDDYTPASAVPPPSDEPAAKPTATKYRWHGNTIRLTERDFDRWQQSFSSLDLPAELESLDAWLSSPEAASQRKGWFHVVAGALKNRNATERAKKQTTNGAAKPARRNTINAEPGKLYADLL